MVNGFTSSWMFIVWVLLDGRFLEEVVSLYLEVLFINECKCNCTSLVMVVHSLGFFLHKPFLSKLLEGY
jgi:hypothetical protein